MTALADDFPLLMIDVSLHIINLMVTPRRVMAWYETDYFTNMLKNHDSLWSSAWVQRCSIKYSVLSVGGLRMKWHYCTVEPNKAVAKTPLNVPITFSKVCSACMCAVEAKQ